MRQSYLNLVYISCYNNEHYHTSLGMITPADYHAGKAPAIIA